jgi:hypothetical protein
MKTRTQTTTNNLTNFQNTTIKKKKTVKGAKIKPSRGQNHVSKAVSTQSVNAQMMMNPRRGNDTANIAKRHPRHMAGLSS